MDTFYRDVICKDDGATKRVYMVRVKMADGQIAYLSNGCEDMSGSKNCELCRIAAKNSFSKEYRES